MRDLCPVFGVVADDELHCPEVPPYAGHGYEFFLTDEGVQAVNDGGAQLWGWSQISLVLVLRPPNREYLSLLFPFPWLEEQTP